MDRAHQDVRVHVNGQTSSLVDSGETMLLWALRNQLGLKGTRVGCGVGECGACLVLVDDLPVRSCETPVASLSDSTVVTPEGLGFPDDPGRIQQVFLDAQATQCGYCINGMMIAIAALDRSDGVPSEAEIVEALDDQICRCGTHTRILEAARLAVGAHPCDATPTGDTPACPPRATCTVRGAVDQQSRAVPSMPPEIATNPRVEQWITLLEDGRVELRSGRSEIGQGIHTAFAQIVAAQLLCSIENVVVKSPSTSMSPDEAYTAGSRSVQQGGTAVGMAAVAFRRLLLEKASHELGAPPDELTFDSHGIAHAERGTVLTLAELYRLGPVSGAILLSDAPNWSADPIGESEHRLDLRNKLSGAPAYIHDLTLPGMLYARAVLPPTYDASLREFDVAGVERMPGVVQVLRDGRLFVVVAEDEEHAIKAATSLEARVRWDDQRLPFTGDAIDTIRSLPTESLVMRSDPGVEQELATGRVLRATYSRPYQAHGAMAPSCAVAQVDEGEHLTVWSHTQGVFPFRQELATLLRRDPDTITVQHVDGPGCFGHNGADDAAGIAAWAALALPGRPIRFQFSVYDEFGWEPHGSAMTTDVEASVDDAGRVSAWRVRTITDAHMGVRPKGEGDRLMVSWLREDSVDRRWPGTSESGARDIVPWYDIPEVEAVADFVEGPLRTGTLRSVGAFSNLFAIESFVDELADMAGVDPVDFRLAHLSDSRAREVLQVASEEAGWVRHAGPSGRGQGVAVGRYHGTTAYVAMVANVEVSPSDGLFSVSRMTVAVDAGSIINVEGLRQQLEGGVVQGLSRTLKESVIADGRGILSRDWSTYPVLKFSDVPPIDLVLLERPGLPPLGIGESSTPLVPAAIANAVDDAIGIRLRTLPFRAESLQDRLLELDDAEMQRVLVAE